MQYSPEQLSHLYAKAQEANPEHRIRDHAKDIGVGEAALVALGCSDGRAIRLRSRFHDLLPRIEEIEEVMALTRNDHAVHEKTGQYQNISLQGMMGLAIGPEIDLRIFLSQWAYGFAVKEETKNGSRESLQIFDPTGTAIHKIYLNNNSNRKAYQRIIADFASSDQAPKLSLQAPKEKHSIKTNEYIDINGFLTAWEKMADTHEFFSLLKKYQIERLQGLRLAKGHWTQQVQNQSVERLLTLARDKQQSIMVFVGNSGIIQIHTGPINRIVVTGPWLNILDPRFNLHLRSSAIAESWVVKKPTADGIVTSLELFDEQGDMIVQFFGERKPGQAESEGWRQMVTRLANTEIVA